MARIRPSLHVWGKQNGLGAHPGAPPLRYQHENQQRTVSLATPLFGRHDELMKPPTLWQRPRPDSAVLSKLSGFGPISLAFAPPTGLSSSGPWCSTTPHFAETLADQQSFVSPRSAV